MPKRIRMDHPWYELRGAHVRVSRSVRDCDMSEHADWQGAIKAGDEYLWLPHAHLSICALHYAPEDVENE